MIRGLGWLEEGDRVHASALHEAFRHQDLGLAIVWRGGEDPPERVDRLREMVEGFVRLARADVDGESLVRQSADGFGVQGEPGVAGRPQTLGQGGRLLGLRRELLIMMELII